MAGYNIYYAYARADGWWLLDCSDQPLFDYAMLRKYREISEFWIITDPLPLGIAYYVVNRVREGATVSGSTPDSRSVTASGGTVVSGLRKWMRKAFSGSECDWLGRIRKEVNELITQAGYSAIKPYLIEHHKQPTIPLPDYSELLEKWANSLPVNRLMVALAGRLLLSTEVEKVLKSHSIATPKELDLLMRWLNLQGMVRVWPGVGYDQRHILTCFRCGQTTGLKEVSCAACQSPCYACEECINMGKVSFCRPLYAFATINQLKAGDRSVDIRQDWPLTPAQLRASDQLEEFVDGKVTEEALVWAVCGAGKTEVCFQAMAKVLARGGRVLFAIPRRDVVVELEERLRYAFPTLTICALYGGSTQTWEQAELTLATTHQVLRFWRKFDLVILDEVDAFPYKDSAMLKYALDRAVKPGGKKVFLTATPDASLLKRARKGEIELFRIGARHHGYPLPEPEIAISKAVSLAKPDKFLTPELLAWLHESVEGQGSQVFVFVPTIKLAEEVSGQLSRAFADGTQPTVKWVEVSHSKDPLREEKRQRFAAGQFPIFVTTTIMERGITVPKTDVLVLFANHTAVFDVGTLVQMAGRAGRSTQWPTGRVHFVADTVSPAMKEATKQIKELNQYGRQMGFIIH